MHAGFILWQIVCPNSKTAYLIFQGFEKNAKNCLIVVFLRQYLQKLLSWTIISCDLFKDVLSSPKKPRTMLIMRYAIFAHWCFEIRNYASLTYAKYKIDFLALIN